MSTAAGKPAFTFNMFGTTTQQRRFLEAFEGFEAEWESQGFKALDSKEAAQRLSGLPPYPLECKKRRSDRVCVLYAFSSADRISEGTGNYRNNRGSPGWFSTCRTTQVQQVLRPSRKGADDAIPDHILPFYVVRAKRGPCHRCR